MMHSIYGKGMLILTVNYMPKSKQKDISTKKAHNSLAPFN